MLLLGSPKFLSTLEAESALMVFRVWKKKLVLRRGTSFGTMMGCEGVRLTDLCFYLKFKFIVYALEAESTRAMHDEIYF